MPPLTITLSPERHRAPRRAASRRGRTIRSIVEEGLDRLGIKTMEDAAALVARARKRARLSESDALSRAVRETRAVRGG